MKLKISSSECWYKNANKYLSPNNDAWTNEWSITTTFKSCFQKYELQKTNAVFIRKWKTATSINAQVLNVSTFFINEIIRDFTENNEQWISLISPEKDTAVQSICPEKLQEIAGDKVWTYEKVEHNYLKQKNCFDLYSTGCGINLYV